MKPTHAQYLIKHIWTNQRNPQRFFFISAGINIITVSICGWLLWFK